MALVTIVGYPCSGKSTRAQQVKEYLERRLRDESYDGPRLTVVVVDDDNSHVPRSTYDSAFASRGSLRDVEQQADERTAGSKAEKPGRANLFSNVTRNLTPETIVICDSLNYIKGFRYQMYCAAREAHCRVCTVSSPRVTQSSRLEAETSDSRDSAAGQVQRMARKAWRVFLQARNVGPERTGVVWTSCNG